MQPNNVWYMHAVFVLFHYIEHAPYAYACPVRMAMIFCHSRRAPANVFCSKQSTHAVTNTASTTHAVPERFAHTALQQLLSPQLRGTWLEQELCRHQHGFEHPHQWWSHSSVSLTVCLYNVVHIMFMLTYVLYILCLYTACLCKRMYEHSALCRQPLCDHT